MGKRVKCLTCGDIIESTYRHDYRGCSCYYRTQKQAEECADKIREELNLDGNGSDYHKVLCCINDSFCTGVAVDGGSDYLLMSYSRRSQYKVLSDGE